jgi:hypothetical protein
MAVAASLERAPAAGRRAGSFRLLLSRVSRDPTSAAGAVFLIVVASLALLGPVLSPHDPYAIVENEMVKPGKGQAFNRVRVRNLKTGRTIERTWKSGDTVEAADVVANDYPTF